MPLKRYPSVLVALTAIWLVAGLTLDAGAQQPTTPLLSVPGRTIFAIVVVDTFKYRGADAVILRRTETAPHDVILIKKQRVAPDILANAANQLEVVRALEGNDPKTNKVFRVHTNDKPRKYSADAQTWVRDLARAKLKPLNGFGDATYLLVLIPNVKGTPVSGSAPAGLKPLLP